MRRIVITIVILICISIFCWSIAVLAAAKPTPSITSNVCINNATGAMRDLFKGSCPKGWQEVALWNFISAPSPAPTASPNPSGPAPDPTATATPSPTPVVQCQSCVVDAEGNEVGPLYLDGIDPEQEEMVLVTVGGVAMALPVNDSGWVSYQTNNIQFLLWYPEANCAGQGYIAVADSPPSDAQPLVEVWGVQQGPWITGSTVYYAQPPWSVITALSFYGTADPTVPPTSATCQNALQGTNLGVYLAGPPASGSLSGLGTPPFTVNP